MLLENDDKKARLGFMGKHIPYKKIVEKVTHTIYGSRKAGGHLLIGF